MDQERRFKCVVLGSTGVGKTCLTLRFVRDVYEDDQLPTIGASYLTKKVGKFVFEIWDTAGQERYESITPLYYRSAEAAIIVFDVNDKNSFLKAKEWLGRLKKERENPEMPIALAANKYDSDQSDVDLEEADAYARENGLKMFKTSAKTGTNVAEIFNWLASSLPAQPNKVGGNGAVSNTVTNLLSNASPDVKKDGESCC